MTGLMHQAAACHASIPLQFLPSAMDKGLSCMLCQFSKFPSLGLRLGTHAEVTSGVEFVDGMCAMRELSP